MALLDQSLTEERPDPETGQGADAPESRAQHYVWQPPGTHRRVSLDLAVVDQIHQQALRGLGSVPKRGAEVGGVLLGAVGADGNVSILASLPVNCSHSQGSSYTLNNDEYHQLSSTVALYEPGRGYAAEAVGFYRTHTREGLGPSQDDVRIFDALFPGDWPVILLVKPSITRVSQGAFFFRENGTVQRGSSYLEFPFRRRELSEPSGADDGHDDETSPGSWAGAGIALPQVDMAAGETGIKGKDRQALDPMMQQLDKKRDPSAPFGAGRGGDGGSGRNRGNGGDDGNDVNDGRDASGSILGIGGRRPAKPQSESPVERDTGNARGRMAGPNSGRRWALIPLSFLFLLMGLFLGVESSLVLGPLMGKPANPFSLGLRVKPVNNDPGKLQLDWNLSSAPIVGAQDATLYIEDGGASKALPLTRTVLTTTAIEYPAISNTVHFRLDVRLRDNAVYSESVEYHRPGGE